MNLEPYTLNTIIPSRTRYQLRNFVIAQHDTGPMQWRQILLEAQDLMYKIRIAEIGMQKAKIEISRLLESGDPIDALEAEERQLGTVLTERLLTAARMELGWLQELADEVGAYSTEQIEEDQPQYWALRLNRQAELDRLSITQGVTAGNLQSMLNAGLLKKEDEQCAISHGTSRGPETNATGTALNP
jgi:hypothetical protein